MTAPRSSVAAVLFLGLACTAASAQFVPNGWKLTPAGTRIKTGSFPMSYALTPDGKYLLTLNGAQGSTSISVIDLASAKELNRTPVPDAWQGLAVTKAGDKVYVGGGAKAAVFEFSLAGGVLTAGRTFPISAAKDRSSQDFAGDVSLAPDGHLLYVANLYRDVVVVMNPQSGLILSRIKTGRRPYRLLFHPSGKYLYVSSWADGAIGQYDVNSGDRLSNVRVGPHPTDMIWLNGPPPAGANGDAPPAEIKARLFVAAANTNSVFVLGANDIGYPAKLETINLALNQPLGMSPSALGIGADKKQIYAACSDVNALAVIDITGERSLVRAFIPTDAYPAAVAGLPDGRIAILNGHGNSAELVDAPDDAKLNGYTDEVMANAPRRDEGQENAAAPPGNPIRAEGPIKHVIYVVREGNAANEATEWATAAIASDYAVRLGGRVRSDSGMPDPASLPPAGYLWNAASQAGLKIRNYGFEAHNRDKATEDGEQIDRVWDPSLAASTDMEYRGPDPAYPDAERAKEFAGELNDYAQLGEMPQLLLVRIGNDDAALDIMTEAVTKSKFRDETAMFVLSTGVSGAMPASVSIVSPWVRPGGGAADPLAALRTLEIILGLRPMTLFDASATPVFDMFANTPAAGR
jgi:DNA-binding beta-propeller fold protein YncE